MKQSLIYLICAVGFLLITGLPLFLADGCAPRHRLRPDADTVIMRDTLRDTITVTVLDTVPRLVSVRVIGSVDIPLPAPSEGDSARADSIPLPASVPVQCPAAVPQVSRSLSLPVVQKTYSDDSTYTAYVSGIDYHDYPRLDSIRLRRQTAVERIRETVTIRQRASRFHVGLQAGYGLTPAGFQPYIGLGVGFRVWP